MDQVVPWYRSHSVAWKLIWKLVKNIFALIGFIATLLTLVEYTGKDFAFAGISLRMELKSEGAQLSEDIAEFVRVRALNEPEVDFERFEASSAAMRRHSNETRQLYNKEFASNVIVWRNKLNQLGITDGELERFYEYPTNLLGISKVAERIRVASQELCTLSIFRWCIWPE